MPVSLPEILNRHKDAILEGLHTAMPGVVVTYNPVLCVAAIKPLGKRITFTLDGEKQAEDLPEIPDVPVGFPRGGGFAMTWPLEEGDGVWLIFSETAWGEWRETG